MTSAPTFAVSSVPVRASVPRDGRLIVALSASLCCRWRWWRAVAAGSAVMRVTCMCRLPHTCQHMCGVGSTSRTPRPKLSHRRSGKNDSLKWKQARAGTWVTRHPCVLGRITRVFTSRMSSNFLHLPAPGWRLSSTFALGGDKMIHVLNRKLRVLEGRANWW